MKKTLVVFAMTLGLSLCASAADVTGFIVDKSCASNKAMLGNEDCAKRCLGRGDPAVLATEDGKIYQIADQAKVKDVAGKKVTLTGKIEGDKISVDSVKVM
jgi:hypothetical protein